MALLCVALGAPMGACLPADQPVKGKLLHSGINIESPSFVHLGGEPWVMFQVRRTRPGRSRSGTVDLHLVKWPDASERRVLLEGRADRNEWPVIEDASGARFYMTEERLASNGLPIGTLNRVSLKDGIVERIPDVLSYALGGGRRTFYYRRFVDGSPNAELHLHDLNGRDRNLGPLAGQVSLLGDDIFYFITGDEQTLTRSAGFEAPAVPIRKRVSRFQLSGGERFAIATVAVEGVPKTLILDLMAKTEKPLPVENPCCWLDLRGNVFVFAESARAGKPALLHYFDVVTGDDRTLAMPPQLNDVVAIVGRPPDAREALIFDSRRQLAVYRPQGTPVVEMTGLRPAVPSFTPDGKFLLFMVPEPPPPPPAVSNVITGQLFVQSTDDWTSAPRQLSPVGASVPIEPKGFLVRDGKPYPLVYWARYGLGASDLYLGDHETGLSVRVAEGIGEVSVSQDRVLGVMNMSQDLTGDLVFREFKPPVEGGPIKVSKEAIIEHGVSDVEIHEDMVAFVVRERMTSSIRNGLWSTKLPSLDDPAPASRVVIPSPGLPALEPAGQEAASVGVR